MNQLEQVRHMCMAIAHKHAQGGEIRSLEASSRANTAKLIAADIAAAELPAPYLHSFYNLVNTELSNSLIHHLRDLSSKIEPDHNARKHIYCEAEIACALDDVADDIDQRHPDDIAIDNFAMAMKEKMAKKRAEGRGGWQTAPVQSLQLMMADHIRKGDPVDVANFCMMLHHLSAPTSDANSPYGYAVLLRSELHDLLPMFDSIWPDPQMAQDHIKDLIQVLIERGAMSFECDLVALPLYATQPAPAVQYDLVKHLARQQAFSLDKFGPGLRTKMVTDHILKELKEIEANPTDPEEWVDIVNLGLDGALRTGATPQQIAAVIDKKLTTNEQRTWPDWRTADPDKAIEHIKSENC